MASANKKNAPEGPVEVPEIISILPLRNSVLFPGSIIPIERPLNRNVPYASIRRLTKNGKRSRKILKIGKVQRR